MSNEKVKNNQPAGEDPVRARAAKYFKMRWEADRKNEKLEELCGRLFYQFSKRVLHQRASPTTVEEKFSAGVLNQECAIDVYFLVLQMKEVGELAEFAPKNTEAVEIRNCTNQPEPGRHPFSILFRNREERELGTEETYMHYVG